MKKETEDWFIKWGFMEKQVVYDNEKDWMVLIAFTLSILSMIGIVIIMFYLP